jgi:hypothetical protein
VPAALSMPAAHMSLCTCSLCTCSLCTCSFYTCSFYTTDVYSCSSDSTSWAVLGSLRKASHCQQPATAWHLLPAIQLPCTCIPSGSSASTKLSSTTPTASVGHSNTQQWDLYWTVRPACHKALPQMQPGQRVSCVPGVQRIVFKKEFMSSIQEVYGEHAFEFSPRGYLLPQQYSLWRSAIAKHGWDDSKLWVLKRNMHQGKGVAVMPQAQALKVANVTSDSGVIK